MNKAKSLAWGKVSMEIKERGLTHSLFAPVIIPPPVMRLDHERITHLVKCGVAVLVRFIAVIPADQFGRILRAGGGEGLIEYDLEVQGAGIARTVG